MATPQGFSEDERLDVIRKVFTGIGEGFDRHLEHCRWTNKSYEETKISFIQEANHLMSEIVEEHNLMLQVQGMQRGTKRLLAIEHRDEENLNNIAKVRANIVCYRCGKEGHYARIVMYVV